MPDPYELSEEDKLIEAEILRKKNNLPSQNTSPDNSDSLTNAYQSHLSSQESDLARMKADIAEAQRKLDAKRQAKQDTIDAINAKREKERADRAREESERIGRESERNSGPEHSNSSETYYGQGSVADIPKNSNRSYTPNVDRRENSNSEWNDYSLEVSQPTSYEPDLSSGTQYGAGSMVDVNKIPNDHNSNQSSDEIDYLKFSKDSYEDKTANSLPDGFHVVKSEYKSNGYGVSVYANDETREIVIAYSGSDDPKKDLRDWFIPNDDNAQNVGSALFGEVHGQVDDALITYNKIKDDYSNYNITLTGHSLGGYLAETVAVQDGKVAYSFDPLYAGHMLKDYPNIVRTLPSGDGIYKFTERLYQKNLALSPADLSLLLFSPHFYAVKLGFEVSQLLHNHGIDNIYNELNNNTAIIDNLNPKAIKIIDHAYFKIWS